MGDHTQGLEDLCRIVNGGNSNKTPVIGGAREKEILLKACPGSENYGAKWSFVGHMSAQNQDPTIPTSVHGIEGLEIKAFDTPGHTNGHIVFQFPAQGLCFSGDCLFAMGCGRLFEGTPADMYQSFKTIRDAMGKEDIIYCAHEYTTANARFTEAMCSSLLKKQAEAGLA